MLEKWHFSLWMTDVPSQTVPLLKLRAEARVTLWVDGESKDGLHQVVAFNLTVLMFVLGLLLSTDVTPTTPLSNMFCSLNRHYAVLLLMF